MAWVAPTVEDFKARHPEFAAVDDALIQLMLDEVIPSVGANWRERDRSPAIMYRVAHMLAMDGYGTVINAAVGIGGVGAVKRRRVGDVEVERVTIGGGSGGGGGDASWYALTTYGMAYWRLLRLNFAAVAVA